MIINLVRYDRNGDGTQYRRTPLAWNTDTGDLDASSASRYGGGYEFVGTDTLEGGLALTLRFKDVHDVDTFMDIAHAAYKDTELNEDEVARWGRFMDTLAALIGAAPRMFEPPQPIAWPSSYHADIDARRAAELDLEPGTTFDEWPSAEEGPPPR